MSDLNDVLNMLPPCPKCGARAKMKELYGEGRIQCSSDNNNCYHTNYYTLDGSARGYKAPGNTLEERWMYIMAEWTKRALEYPSKKAYRDDLKKRRCECGKVNPNGALFCSKCGKEVIR